MKIFLSYASEDRALAEEIQLALSGAAHEVFFDRQSLPAGGDYHERIRNAVGDADLFVFLISPDSVDAGGYALTEMGYARDKWAHPKGRLLPVMARPTPFESIPAYLKSVTLLEPSGNTPAEVLSAVAKLAAQAASRPSGAGKPQPAAVGGGGASAAGMGATLKLGLIAGAVLIAGAAAVFFKPWQPADAELVKLERLIDAANTACVSNSDVQNAAKVGADLNLLLDKIKGEGGISEYRKKNVGANQALPPELQPPENAEIRKCMATYMPGIFKAMGIELASSQSADAGLPRLLQLRFSLDAAADSKVTLDDTVRVNLQAPRIVDGERLAKQPQGYFVHNTEYPSDGKKVLGTVVRELRESTLAGAPAPANFCLQRPNPLLKSEDPHHVHLDCAGNGVCKLHFPSPLWLEACRVEAPKTSLGFSLLPMAHAATAADRRWSVPSAKTLDAHRAKLKGVGYTIVDIQTDAFQDPAVVGVEVDVRVNGTPIYEDGLAPGQRPVPNDPGKPFRHSYALQSLDFQGAQAGCEAISLTLRPRLADGRPTDSTNPPASATLPYVALRDKDSTTIPFGKGTLTWSARYVVPDAEWSHEAFIASLSYAASAGEEIAAATRRSAVELKERFDRLKVLYQGRALVAVIRPPLTQKADRLAYGLTAGVVQDSGQVRFTFSKAEAQSIAAAMLDWRARNPAARNVINPAAYIYEVAGNSSRQNTPTPPGVCKHVKPI